MLFSSVKLLELLFLLVKEGNVWAFSGCLGNLCILLSMYLLDILETKISLNVHEPDDPHETLWRDCCGYANQEPLLQKEHTELSAAEESPVPFIRSENTNQKFTEDCMDFTPLRM